MYERVSLILCPLCTWMARKERLEDWNNVKTNQLKNLIIQIYVNMKTWKILADSKAVA